MLDRLGALFATLCAIHCAALPIAFATSTSFTLALLSWKDPRHAWATALLRLSTWEAWAIGAALAFASVCIALGFCRHRRVVPACLLVAAAAAFVSALRMPVLNTPLEHSLLAMLGGLLLIAAHGVNARARRDAACATERLAELGEL